MLIVGRLHVLTVCALVTGAVTGAAISSVAFAQQPPAVPATPPPPVENPPGASPEANPSTVSPGTQVSPPDATEVRKRLDEALAAQPAGLRAVDVAKRADASSPEIQAKQRAIEAAAAKMDEAAALYIPQVSFTGRYVRLSPQGEANLSSSGSIVGTTLPAGRPLPVQCPPGATHPSQCFVPAAGVNMSFPVLLNMWTLQASVGVPLSDYVLRISQNHESTKKSKKVAELQMAVARSKIQTDAKVAYYNWLRAKGSVIVAEQGLATAVAHLKDVKIAEQVGVASRADLMAVESSVASTELLVEKSKNMEALAHEQLRVMMHDPENTRYKVGEDTTAKLTAETGTLKTLYEEALRQRLERRVIDESVSAIQSGRKAVAASNYPRLAAFGNLYYQNPNTRSFPQEEKWKGSWDVGVQLTWTMNDLFSTRAKTSELDAKMLELEAQRAQLDDGIRLQVTQAFNALRDAETASASTERQLASAEEAYRVRRELFRAGRATSSELTDAETTVLKAGFDLINARVDIRVARENLARALGRDNAQ